MKIEGSSLEEYVKGMINKSIPQTAFWYANVNPYDLKPEYENYLKENFVQQEKLEYFDAWANYYVPKNNFSVELDKELDLKRFNHVKFDETGSIVLPKGISTFSTFMTVEKGNYELVLISRISSKNGTDKPRVKIKVNGEVIANFGYSDTSTLTMATTFKNSKYEKIRLQIIYDNSNLDNNIASYAIIKKILIRKGK